MVAIPLTWQLKCEAQVLDAHAVHRHGLCALALEPGLVACVDGFQGFAQAGVDLANVVQVQWLLQSSPALQDRYISL